MNPDLVKSLEIEELTSRLDLSKDPSESRRRSYNEQYPTGWARNQHTEIRHRESVHKIVHWPASDNNKVEETHYTILKQVHPLLEMASLVCWLQREVILFVKICTPTQHPRLTQH